MVIKTELVILGAGPAGYEAAIHAAQCGMQVVLIEKDQVGGTCLNRGCIPTKSLLYQAHQLHTAAQYAAIDFDSDQLRKQKEETVAKLQKGIAQLIKGNQIQYITGEARIIDAQTVCVNDETIEAEHILIATGSKASVPPIPGIEHAMTSDQVLAWDRPLPKQAVIIGAGVIGLEFADLLLDLGVAVTLLEAAPRPLIQADREIAQNLQMILKRRGAQIHCGVSITQIRASEVDYLEKEKPQTAQGEWIIAATGRKPVLCDCDLELLQERGRLVTDACGKTSIPTIYAAGDVTSRIQLAHLASAQAINAVDAMLGRKPQFDLTCIPSCLYTHPEAAWVGLSEEEAQAQGREILIGKTSTLGNAKSMIEQAPRGFVKLIADAATRQILGGIIVGAHASDWIGTIAQAVSLHLTVDDCQRVIVAHPTWSEALHEALMDVDQHAIHTLYSRLR